jgi:hypothetical protein
MSPVKVIIKRVEILLLLLIFSGLLGGNVFPSDDPVVRARAFTRDQEFDYVGWMAEAMMGKVDAFALGAGRYLTPNQRRQVVSEYLELTYRTQVLELQITDIYANPIDQDPESASVPFKEDLRKVQERRKRLDPIAEQILQDQVSAVAAEIGLTLGGQPVPPVLFHTTPLPLALIISPRDEIRQLADISLIPELSIEDQVRLEDQVDRVQNTSSLVVNIGGVGVYPTMVNQTSNLPWLSEVVSHEWVHNFLTLRPLGIHYYANPQMRTINETVASIAGKEMGQRLLEIYYPELAPPPAPPIPPSGPVEKPAEPVFDFYDQMRLTRIQVDQLLAEGKVSEAEDYMEQQRIVFWEHGYRQLRKLNQAYFAFHGAYADQAGGGAAGEDPVGAAVRALRAYSPSLRDFIERISWMSSFEELQRAVASLENAH